MGCTPSKTKDQVLFYSVPEGTTTNGEKIEGINSLVATESCPTVKMESLSDISKNTNSNNSKNISSNISKSNSISNIISNSKSPIPESHHISRLSRPSLRRGYSSGASSCSDTDSGDYPLNSEDLNSSKHSGILNLSVLRREIVKEGSLSQTVVRLETPFGKPISEIYSGVQDGKVLGSGVSGVVRAIQHRATGVNYAVKCLDTWMVNSIEGLKQLRDEISIMCQLDHPNIVRIEEVYESENEIYIVQELCLGGDLFDRLDQQPDFHYTEVQCARLVKQMLSSVRYLHSKKIIHRDLKLENFLFTSTKHDSNLKMIDFGLSKHFQVGQSLEEKVGTPYTVAPEIIRGKYDEKCDVWSIGVITYLLLSGETPFGGLDGESMIFVRQQIMKAQLKFTPVDVWDKVSEDGKNFVKLLLNPDPNQRPSAKEAQRNPWIRVWSKKDATEATQLSSKTLTALMDFKQTSDMQKILSEVLSFTLLPEQIEELRDDFEKIDTDGDGEISLSALKRVLLENAVAGELGSLTEKEIEEIFDSIRVRKSEPTIRWHEFLAAGLSQARVDDRNLRLAFDRLDSNRKGFIIFDDLADVLGSTTGYEELEKMWLESVNKTKNSSDRITFEEFKLLMKGQPKEAVALSSMRASGELSHSSLPRQSRSGFGSASFSGSLCLNAVPEGANATVAPLLDDKFRGLEDLDEEEMENPRLALNKQRSTSYDQVDSCKFARSLDAERRSLAFPNNASLSQLIEESDDVSPLVANRTIYRKHREMRFGVLEASKQFDKKRDDRNSKGDVGASLIMRRGAKTPIELEDSHTRLLYEKAAARCGRARHRKNKTLSDVSLMLSKD